MRGLRGGICAALLALCACAGPSVTVTVQGQSLEPGKPLTTLEPGAMTALASAIEIVPEYQRLERAPTDVTSEFTVTPADVAAQWASTRLRPGGQGAPLQVVIADAAVDRQPARTGGVLGAFTSPAFVYTANLRVRLEQDGAVLGSSGTMTTVTVAEDATAEELAQARVRLIDRLLTVFDAAMTREARARAAAP